MIHAGAALAVALALGACVGVVQISECPRLNVEAHLVSLYAGTCAQAAHTAPGDAQKKGAPKGSP